MFLKSVERGKCFIEYIPAECAWNPIEAPGYMYINCLWVSGSFPKAMDIQVTYFPSVLRTAKKRGRKAYVFLQQQGKSHFADSKFLKYKGFKACDEADNGIQLWYSFSFEEKTEPPVFKECAKHHHINESGYVLCHVKPMSF